MSDPGCVRAGALTRIEGFLESRDPEVSDSTQRVACSFFKEFSRSDEKLICEDGSELRAVTKRTIEGVDYQGYIGTGELSRFLHLDLDTISALDGNTLYTMLLIALRTTPESVKFTPQVRESEEEFSRSGELSESHLETSEESTEASVREEVVTGAVTEEASVASPSSAHRGEAEAERASLDDLAARIDALGKRRFVIDGGGLSVRTESVCLHAKQVMEGGYGRVFLLGHERGGAAAVKVPRSARTAGSFEHELHIMTRLHETEADPMGIQKPMRRVRLLSMEPGRPRACNEGLIAPWYSYGDLTTVSVDDGFRKHLPSLCWQVIEGLRYAHREEIVHNDIKPENLFLTAEAGERGPLRLDLCDWGGALPKAAFCKRALELLESTRKKETADVDAVQELVIGRGATPFFQNDEYVLDMHLCFYAAQAGEIDSETFTEQLWELKKKSDIYALTLSMSVWICRESQPIKAWPKLVATLSGEALVMPFNIVTARAKQADSRDCDMREGICAADAYDTVYTVASALIAQLQREGLTLRQAEVLGGGTGAMKAPLMAEDVLATMESVFRP